MNTNEYMNNLFDIFQYSFMIRAFIAGLMIAAIAPLIGNFLVIKRYSLIADTLSHVALSGVAIGLILGIKPIITTLIITIIAALAIEKLRTDKRIPSESILAMLLPGGLALSIVLMSVANGFNTNLFSFLFGSITTVTNDDLVVTLILGIFTSFTVILFHKKLLYAAFDEDNAKTRGIPVEFINTILIMLTAITVSISMRIVGVLLIGALMVIPVVTAMQIAKSFLQTISISILFAQLSVIAGLCIAYYLNLPAGGVIVLLSLSIFGIISVLHK